MNYETALLISYCIKNMFVKYSNGQSQKRPKFGSFLSPHLQNFQLMSIHDYMTEDVWSLLERQQLKLLQLIIDYNQQQSVMQAGVQAITVANSKRIFFNLNNFNLMVFPPVDDSQNLHEQKDSFLNVVAVCKLVLSKQMPSMQQLGREASHDLWKQNKLEQAMLAMSRRIINDDQEAFNWLEKFKILTRNFLQGEDLISVVRMKTLRWLHELNDDCSKESVDVISSRERPRGC